MSFELSYDELDGYLRQIFSGRALKNIKDKDNKEVSLLFYYPTLDDIEIGEYVYGQVLEETRKEGLPTLAEMKETIKKRGIYTEKDEEEITRLRSKLQGQKAVLSKTTRVPARRERLKEIISNIEKEIETILIKREVMLEMTCERKANEAKFLYYVQRGVRHLRSKELFWPDQGAFEKEPDFLFRKRVFVEYVKFSHGLRPEIIRYVARSNLWRVRYVTATKTGEPLFGQAITQYNVDRTMLLYWSHYYQSIYEMMPDEKPPESIIEDDAALDAYMKDWHEERERSNSAARGSSKHKYGQPSAWDHGETLVMRSNPMHEDIKYSKTIPEQMGEKTPGVALDAAPMRGKEKRKGIFKKPGKG